MNKSLKLFDGIIDRIVEISSFKYALPFKIKFSSVVQDMHTLLDILPEKDLDFYLKIIDSYIFQLEKDLENKELQVNPDVISNIIDMASENLYQYFRSLTNMHASLNDKINNNNDTPIKEIIPTCTLEQSGINYLEQKIYRCKTCNLTGSLGICEACVNQCHKTHSIVYAGKIKGYCDCAFSNEKCELLCKCTYYYTKNTFHKQMRYICNTCGLLEQKGSAICQFCITKCHTGHDIKKIGLTKCFCDCQTLPICTSKKI